MISFQPAPAEVIDSSRAWIAAWGVALANGVAFGIAYSFGTFFDAMADEFGADRGSTAVIFAITLLLFFGFGAISGPLSDRVGPAPLLIAGTVLFVAGLLATSVVDELWLGYLTYGVGVGLGGGCFVAPLTGAAGALFEKKRPTALGVVATGNGLGTLALVPFAEWLISNEGWRVAYRSLAVVMAIAGILGVFAIVRPPQRPATKDARDTSTNRALLAMPTFRKMFVAGFLMSMALLSSFAFIVPFAKDNGISGSTAAWAMSVVGLTSIVGRLGLTSLSERVGPLRIFQLMLALQPLAYVLWLITDGSVALLFVFASAIGVTYGGFVAISPEVAITLFGADNVGRLLGLLFLSFGVGGLLGPPLAGWLDDAAGQTPVILGAICIVLTALAVALTIDKPDRLGAT